MKRIYRSQTDKKVAGIFGGIAEAYDLDSTLLRVVAFVLGIETLILPLTIAYLIGWAILPKGPVPADLRTPPRG